MMSRNIGSNSMGILERIGSHYQKFKQFHPDNSNTSNVHEEDICEAFWGFQVMALLMVNSCEAFS